MSEPLRYHAVERVLSERARRVLRYLNQRAGKEVARDEIMHWTGFPSPKAEPIGAYAAFATTVLELNRHLPAHRLTVARRIDEKAFGRKFEHYRLVPFEEPA